MLHVLEAVTCRQYIEPMSSRPNKNRANEMHETMNFDLSVVWQTSSLASVFGLFLFYAQIIVFHFTVCVCACVRKLTQQKHNPNFCGMSCPSGAWCRIFWCVHRMHCTGKPPSFFGLGPPVQEVRLSLGLRLSTEGYNKHKWSFIRIQSFFQKFRARLYVVGGKLMMNSRKLWLLLYTFYLLGTWIGNQVARPR